MKEPVWLLKSTIIATHEAAIAENGGFSGFRDERLFDSALARPVNLFAYELCDIFDLAAAYAFGIVKNHAFLDGNKRTGFLATRVFLLRNGYTITASREDKIDVFVKLASSIISEKMFTQWLRDNSEPLTR